MKKLLSLAFTLLIGMCFLQHANSQTFRATTYYGTTSSSIIVTLKPDFNFNDKLNEVGFALQVPKIVAGVPVSLPAITVLNNILSTTFSDWSQQSELTDPNYYNFKFGATGFASAPVLSVANGAELDVLELQLPASYAAVIPFLRLAHLPMGGPASQYGVAFFDASGNDRTNYRQMFYGPGVVPATPATDETVGYNTYQYITTSLRPVTVKFTDFTAIKNNDDALLNWKIENENDMTDRYEIERSFNGLEFNKINTIAPKKNGSAANSYDYTDFKLSSIGSKGVIYYRIKQLDKDGQFVYTQVRSVRLDGKTFDVSVYPNPVVNSGDVYIDLSDASQINAKLIDATGKIIRTAVINGTKGLNTYSLSMNKFAAGIYIIQVEAGKQSKSIPVIKK